MEDVLDGQELLFERMPGAIAQHVNVLREQPLIQIKMGLEEIGSRMDELQQFVYSVANKGFCRCNVYKDPSCVVCQAKTMIEGWNASTPEAIPPPVY